MTNKNDISHSAIFPVERVGLSLIMSSREIAELVNSRHDKVKQSIERLAERGTIGLPPLGEYLDALGRKASEYQIGKRDSYVIVAQLSPEFTARLVDRWQELEAKQQPEFILSDPVSLRGLLGNYVERVLSLESHVADLLPKADALGRLAEGNGSFCITDAAKTLQVQPKALFAFLRSHRWIYTRAGGSTEVAYQDKLASGLLEHKTTTVHRSDGSERVATQVRVTPKGLARLAQEFPAIGRAA